MLLRRYLWIRSCTYIRRDTAFPVVLYLRISIQRLGLRYYSTCDCFQNLRLVFANYPVMDTAIPQANNVLDLCTNYFRSCRIKLMSYTTPKTCRVRISRWTFSCARQDIRWCGGWIFILIGLYNKSIFKFFMFFGYKKNKSNIFIHIRCGYIETDLVWTVNWSHDILPLINRLQIAETSLYW